MSEMAARICKLCLFKCESDDETQAEWLIDVENLIEMINDLFHQMVTLVKNFKTIIKVVIRGFFKGVN